MIEHETFTWFAAIDWGTEKHQACVVDVRGGIAGERAFSHDGAGLALLCDWILSIVGNATIVAVAVEVPHGPVVDALLDRGLAVYAINPKQLDRLRDRFSVLVPRTIGETPTSRPMGCAPIGICFAVCKSLIRASSSCVSGHGLPKSSSRKGYGSAIACIVNSGGIIPRCSGSATILLPVGFSIFGQWRPRLRKRCTSARPALRSCLSGIASVASTLKPFYARCANPPLTWPTG